MGGSPIFSPSPYKLKALERVDRDLFIVHATKRYKRILKIQRNMIVLRHNRELTVVNPIRLDEQGERQLQRLGTIRQAVCLSSISDREDAAYYEAFFHAKLWSPEQYDRQTAMSVDKTSDVPIPKAQVFFFRDTIHPEAALVLERPDGNVLITSESMQHQWENPFVNVATLTVMQLNGLMEDLVVVSPKWLRAVSPKRGNLRDDFERLLRLDFSIFIGASGTMLPVQAKEAAVIAVERAFPVWD